MHTEQGVKQESMNSGMMEETVGCALSQSETMNSRPTDGLDLNTYSEITLNNIASTFPYALLETPSPITEELPFPIGPETPEKKCQNAPPVPQNSEEDTDSDSDREENSFGLYLRRPLTREERRQRKRIAFLKWVFGLLFGGSSVLVLCLLLVKWIHEFSKSKDDEIIMVCLVFLALGLWSLFFLFMFQFLFVCPTNCEFNDEDDDVV